MAQICDGIVHKHARYMSDIPHQTLSLDAALQQAISHHQAGRLREAEQLYRAILQVQPLQAEANHNLGVIACQVGQHAAGLPYLKTAVSARPDHKQFLLSYADALLATGHVQEVQQILQGEVLRDDNSPAANALRNKVSRALLNVDVGVETDINHLITLFNAGRHEELERAALALLERNPDSGIVWKVLGASRKMQGKEAISALQNAVKFSAGDAEAHSNLGIALQDLGQLDDAVASYRRALEINANTPEIHNNLGVALKDLGRLDDAAASYRRALEINSRYAEAQNNLGFVQQELGRVDEAIASYRRAVEMKYDLVEAHYNLGNALKALDQFELAASSYRRALDFRPEYAEAHNNLGFVQQECEQFDDALASYRQALRIKPDYVEAHYNLGTTLQNLKDQESAAASYRRAIEIKPDFVEAYANLGLVLKDLGQLDNAFVHYLRAVEIKPDFVLARNNFLYTLQFVPTIAKQELFDAHKRFGEQFETPLKANWLAHTNSRDPDKRLKIGYVSGDFRQHAVAFFIEPVLVHHDKSQVEVFCYSNNRVHDVVTDRLCSAVDHWVPCFNLTDDELAQRIRADGIDILIDLSGHTAHNRLLTFARKPAPIQMTYLGYPGSSGLSAMDYRLTDHHTESGDDQYYTEQLLRLPDSLWCYQPAESMPEVTPLPALANGYLTFGSFNNFNKIGDGCIALWAKLLRNVPNARLLMATVPEGEARARLARQFAELGITGDRVDYCGNLPSREFQRKLQLVDITLDPFPVNGATTTCESLWLGVPVLTLVGERFLSRAGLSVLSAAGLSEFAAASPEHFIAVASDLAKDLPRLATIRAGMRERLRSTPLLDQRRFTRNLEGIYRDAWRRYVSASLNA
jgi:protein O-GlcNAc transferase